jgi:hypothetical protein
MSGWSVAEHDDRGAMRWIISKVAELRLPARWPSRSRLRIVAGYAVSKRKTESLRLTGNGRAIAGHRRSSGGGIVYEAQLDPHIIATSPLPRVESDVDQLDAVPGNKRPFGIAIRKVEILPAGAVGIAGTGAAGAATSARIGNQAVMTRECTRFFSRHAMRKV